MGNNLKNPENTDLAQLPKKKKKKKRGRPKSEAKEHEERLEAEGMDTFFRSDSYIPAHPDEHEGHYPNNQNNAVLLPTKSRLVHS